MFKLESISILAIRNQTHLLLYWHVAQPRTSASSHTASSCKRTLALMLTMGKKLRDNHETLIVKLLSVLLKVYFPLMISKTCIFSNSAWFIVVFASVMIGKRNCNWLAQGPCSLVGNRAKKNWPAKRAERVLGKGRGNSTRSARFDSLTNFFLTIPH